MHFITHMCSIHELIAIHHPAYTVHVPNRHEMLHNYMVYGGIHPETVSGMPNFIANMAFQNPM